MNPNVTDYPWFASIGECRVGDRVEVNFNGTIVMYEFIAHIPQLEKALNSYIVIANTEFVCSVHKTLGKCTLLRFEEDEATMKTVKDFLYGKRQNLPVNLIDEKLFRYLFEMHFNANALYESYFLRKVPQDKEDVIEQFNLFDDEEEVLSNLLNVEEKKMVWTVEHGYTGVLIPCTCPNKHIASFNEEKKRNEPYQLWW